MTDSPAAGNAASTIPAGFSRDPDHWYRRWLWACRQLDEEGAQRVAHYAALDRKVVAAACTAAVAAERERAEALIVQAQDYASAESERADKLAGLALKALNECQALHPTGEAGYLDEWGMALDQLESAAGEMSPPDSDPLEDANQAGIKWERERIIRLASELRASFPADHPKGAQASFADYLRVTSADSGEPS